MSSAAALAPPVAPHVRLLLLNEHLNGFPISAAFQNALHPKVKARHPKARACHEHPKTDSDRLAPAGRVATVLQLDDEVTLLLRETLTSESCAGGAGGFDAVSPHAVPVLSCDCSQTVIHGGILLQLSLASFVP